MASHLAQKEYANKIISMAETDLEVMKKMSKIHKAEDYIGIYNTIADGKRLLVKPFILSDEEYITSWLEGKRKGDQSYIDVEEEDAIVTEKGEFVRSKSEKILADKLFSMGIPYRYEEPLYLNDYKRVLPDFTVLNIRTREEMYWEHLGMMDESDYCENAIRKIESYEKNNIFPGKKLILTYETLKHPLNSGVVDALIKEYLL